MHQVVKVTDLGVFWPYICTEEKAIDYVFGLLEIPWFYYTIAVLLGVVVWWVWKKASLGLLTGYYILLLAETVLIRKPFVGTHFQPELFWSWRAWSAQKNQILTNIVMFIPIGVLVGRIWRWRGLWVAAGLSSLIEILQLITARGLMEFDDILHNCFGAAIGIGIAMLFRKLSRDEETEW